MVIISDEMADLLKNILFDYKMVIQNNYKDIEDRSKTLFSLFNNADEEFKREMAKMSEVNEVLELIQKTDKIVKTDLYNIDLGLDALSRRR